MLHFFSQTPRGIWWKNCIIILHQETDVIRTKLRSSILANGHFFFQKIFKQARSNYFTFVKKTFQSESSWRSTGGHHLASIQGGSFEEKYWN